MSTQSQEQRAGTEMPETITTPDGTTYYKTRFTGTALGPAKRHGIEPGETTYEYWWEYNDSRRLHAAAPDRWFLD